MESEMKLIAILLGAVAVLASAPVHADEIPKVQLGTWCVGDRGRGTQIATEEDREICVEDEKVGRILEFKRDRFDWTGGLVLDERCKIKSVKRTKTQFALSTKARFPDEWNPVVQIKVRCAGNSLDEKYELVNIKGVLYVNKMLSRD
jgi:hypothetical protein